VTRSALYRVLLLPLAAWTIHVTLGFALISLHCQRRAMSQAVLSVSLVRIALLILTGINAALIVSAGLSAWSLNRRAIRDGQGAGAAAFVFLLSALVCGLALLYLCWSVVITQADGLCK